jgi:pimeloyl-ACP methyl ester carboxylesterase
VVDPHNGDLLADLLPDARLERFPGTGHLFFWEEPERFVSSVTAFLEGAA